MESSAEAVGLMKKCFLIAVSFGNITKFNTDVINLGSTSVCHAFDYEGLPICGSNFALRHNSLSGDLAILKNYFGYLNPTNSHVIIPLCAFSSLAAVMTLWKIGSIP